MMQSYQTKLKNMTIVLPNSHVVNTYEYYERVGKEFGQIERKLFVDLYVRERSSGFLKTHYCGIHDITSRQYNSIKKQLDGRVAARKASAELNIEQTKQKVQNTNELIQKMIKQKETQHQKVLKLKGNEPTFEKQVNRYRRIKFNLHQKKRKLYRLQEKLNRLEQDKKQGIVRLCFGSKDLFHQQFHLEENNLTFNKWKQNWQEARSAQFTYIGSKDETFGNQTCTYDLDNNLRIRVSNKDEKVYGTHVVVPDVTFSYGQEQLDRAKISYVGYTKGKGDKKNYYRALTPKFIRQNGSWYLTMSVDIDVPDIQSLSLNGAVGVDFNAQFLAVTDVDRFGNVIHSFHVPFRSHHVSSEQAKQSLSEALKIVTAYAAEKQKPIVYEKLDFKKKKQQLNQLSKKQAKLLSGFAYKRYQDMLNSKCKKRGIETGAVNPAYTSQIGHHIFMKRYGLSSHCAAAAIIARKGLKFKSIEKVPTDHWINGNKEKMMKKPRFQQWKELTKQWKTYTYQQKMHVLTHAF